MDPDVVRLRIGQARGGNPEACEELIHRHLGDVYRFLLHLSGDADLAEDLTQETFAAAWAGLGTFRGESGFGTWLYRIARRKWIDAGRSGKRRESLILRREPPTLIDTRDPIEPMLRDERDRWLVEAVQALEGADREVIVLHYFQDLSLRDVAAVRGEPVGTVKWRTGRALGRLRDILRSEDDDGRRLGGVAGSQISGRGPSQPAPASGP